VPGRQENPQVGKRAGIFAYLKIVAALEAIVLGTNLGANIIQFKNAFLAPPLGSEGAFILPPLYVAAAICTIALWLMRSRGAANTIAVFCMALFLAAILIYAHFVHDYVRYIPSTAKNTTYMVSVGSDRTQYAKDKYGGLDDVKMLSNAGWEDEMISTLFTSASLESGRRKLWLSYFLMLVSAQLFVGGIARSSSLE
jgi:hypothetical protein